MGSKFSPLFGCLVAAMLIGASSFCGGSYLGAFVALFGTVVLVFSVQSSSNERRDLFAFGVVVNLLSFYWLSDTITFFGGFPLPVAAVLFALYALVSAIQFFLCGWVVCRLRLRGVKFATLSFPVAWLVTEYFIPRLFPWCLSHLFLPWRYFSGLAEFAGASPLSGLLLWWLAVPIAFVTKRISLTRSELTLCLASCCLFLGVGAWRDTEIQNRMLSSQTVRVALVQGNLEAKKKGNAQYFAANIEKYRELSEQAKAQGAALVIWPETVVTVWVPEDIPSVRGTRADPAPSLGLPIIYGGLSFRQQGEVLDSETAARFNSGLAIDSSGQLLGRYHKKVLMPFGEYLPLADKFPWIKEISPQTGDFTAGNLSAPIEIKLAGDITVNAGMLICYEDLISSLSREASLAGANLLVNLTNDAWYGDTAAPHQHNLIASWRAIETRRTLLRVTNTGTTAIIDPLGQTTSELPIFSEGVLVKDVQLLVTETSYALYGEIPSLILIACLLLIISKRGKLHYN